MNRRCRRDLRLAAVLVFLCVGCGPRFEYGQVKGTVTLDRKPLGGAVVYFYPIVKVGNPVPPSSSGTTDAAGNYELMTRTDIAGAAVGLHKVVVLFPATGGRDDAKRPKIPQDYTLAAKTPLQREVKPGLGDYPLELKTTK
jgi:hypothetical protein